MKKLAFSLVALSLLAGCTSGKPGAFERVDEDPRVNTVQYRFNPEKVDRDAMLSDISSYCNQRGFDKVDELPTQDSTIPGLEKKWYQCNYAIKG
ncbi:hypothetical protein [Pantoea sp. 1.19]|uniref:hypothetical protein n=1 Tax=Pantoea sp. 1.19 TaxID=1925589 RepID=UPI000948CF81|nr:hypothetical protein [Pantoea sp. 1.19]